MENPQEGHCSKCQKPLLPEERFCGSCGTVVPTEPEPVPATTKASGNIVGGCIIMLIMAGGLIWAGSAVVHYARNKVSSTMAKINTATDAAPIAVTDEPQPQSGTNTGKINGASTPSSSKEKTEYEVGELIKLRDHEIIVEKVIRNFRSSNQFDKPQKSSNCFVVVDVSITNTSDKDLLVNSFGFTLEDDDGAKRSMTLIAGLDNQLESLSLKPGGQTSGYIGFEAKKDSNLLKLHYEGNIWSGGEKVIDLTRGQSN